ncbi:unnamed protein product [Umbelopsis ramanniana]
MLQITLLYLLALTTGSFAAVAGQLRDGDSDVSLSKEKCEEVCTETIPCPLDCGFCVWPQSTKCCPGAGTPTCVLPHTPPINLTLPDQGPNSQNIQDKICKFLCPLQKPCPGGCKKCAWNPGFACCAFSGPPKCVDPVSSIPTPISNVTRTTSSTKTRSSPTIPPTSTSPPIVTKWNYRPTSLTPKNVPRHVYGQRMDLVLTRTNRPALPPVQRLLSRALKNAQPKNQAVFVRKELYAHLLLSQLVSQSSPLIQQIQLCAPK